MSLFWSLKYRMMPLKCVTNSVLPNAKWILDELNVTNWVWGCRIPRKNTLHNQRTKDYFFKFCFLWISLAIWRTMKRWWPLLSEHQTFVNTFKNISKGPLAQEKRSLILCLSPKRRRSFLTVTLTLTLYLDIPKTGTGIQTSSSLCPSVSSTGSSIGQDVTKVLKTGGQNQVSQWVVLVIKKRRKSPSHWTWVLTVEPSCAHLAKTKWLSVL